MSVCWCDENTHTSQTHTHKATHFVYLSLSLSCTTHPFSVFSILWRVERTFKGNLTFHQQALYSNVQTERERETEFDKLPTISTIKGITPHLKRS